MKPATPVVVALSFLAVGVLTYQHHLGSRFLSSQEHETLRDALQNEGDGSAPRGSVTEMDPSKALQNASELGKNVKTVPGTVLDNPEPKKKLVGVAFYGNFDSVLPIHKMRGLFEKEDHYWDRAVKTAQASIAKFFPISEESIRVSLDNLTGKGAGILGVSAYWEKDGFSYYLRASLPVEETLQVYGVQVKTPVPVKTVDEFIEAVGKASHVRINDAEKSKIKQSVGGHFSKKLDETGVVRDHGPANVSGDRDGLSFSRLNEAELRYFPSLAGETRR